MKYCYMFYLYHSVVSILCTYYLLLFQAYLREGVALKHLGQYGEALAAFAAGLAQEPSNVVLLAELSQAAIACPLRGMDSFVLHSWLLSPIKNYFEVCRNSHEHKHEHEHLQLIMVSSFKHLIRAETGTQVLDYEAGRSITRVVTFEDEA